MRRFSDTFRTVLRVFYGLLLMSTLFLTFAVYHSIDEPYILGPLQGYKLPVGYVGLASGVLAILYGQLGFIRRRLSFSSLLVIFGAALLISVFLSPPDYFINLWHGTDFTGYQIDVDYPIGYFAVSVFAFINIATGALTKMVFKRTKEGRVDEVSGEERLVKKAVVITLVLSFAILAWAPWITDDYAIAKVVEKLGGDERPFNYLGETMPVRDVSKWVVKVPFGALVYFPGEALFIVTFYGSIL